MKAKKLRKNLSYNLPVLISIIVVILLCLIPTGYEDAVIYKGADRCKALVVDTDNSKIVDNGLIKSGEQSCKIRLLSGKFEGKEIDGVNYLTGSLENDKIYVEEDLVLVVIGYKSEEILSVNMIDHYRIDQTILLAGIFAVLLIAFAGKTGIRAILSFVITILSIWKILIPFYLKGGNPIFIGLLVMTLLTVIIISLVYGFDRRCVSAVAGSLLGLITTAVIGIIFTKQFKIHGAVMPNSESLLYSGYQDLNLTKIFMASIFIGASGAVMDLAVDITSAVAEVIDKKPDILWKDAVKSGMQVGKAAMGTMTTTLLLAYSGGYIALLMVFMAQGTPIYNILNYKYVSAEILDTVVGSFGLVTVAPFTALCSGILLTSKQDKIVT